MNNAEKIYDWIERTEKNYVESGIPFSDREIEYLIKALKVIERDLQKVDPDNDAWDQFSAKMERKFFQAGDDPLQRMLLFDFCKNIIHNKLIMNGGRC